MTNRSIHLKGDIARRDAKIVELYVKHGMATVSIATRFGISRESVLDVLNRSDVILEGGRQSYGAAGSSKKISF